jgi:hypothetical protein
MKYGIDYGSLNAHPGTFSLDKFLESDAPGTLAWLNNIEANDLGMDIPAFKELEISSLVMPCAAASFNKQLLCAWCSNRQMELSENMELPDINNPEIK